MEKEAAPTRSPIRWPEWTGNLLIILAILISPFLWTKVWWWFKWPILWPQWSRTVAVILAIIGVPALMVMAYLQWRRNGQTGLPKWRSYLGCASIVLTFLNWLFFIMAVGLALLDFSVESFLWRGVFDHQIDAAFASGLLGLALQRTARLQAITGGLLMLVLLMAARVP